MTPHKTDIQTRLIGMWLRAMSTDESLPGGAFPGGTRAHLEHVLGNEYRHTSPCRDCGETTSKDRTHEKAA